MRGLRTVSGALLGATFFVSALGSGAASAEDMNAEAVDKPTVHRIVIEKFKFVPETLTISVGDRVEWINKDVVPHTATDEAGRFDTDMLSKGQAGGFTASEVGEIDYICAYHPTMLGKLIVQER